uniref:Uncharacterized protein n=1 Tax=Ananas comosus var. bracteatus TaxID=296719 RepID=A0A6V7NW99_ANACO|nr:unnamed protein product [Ananas comosus var. bracteatus]
MLTLVYSVSSLGEDRSSSQSAFRDHLEVRTTWRSADGPGLGCTWSSLPTLGLKGESAETAAEPLGTMEDSSHPTLFPVVGAGLPREDRGKGIAPDQCCPFGGPPPRPNRAKLVVVSGRGVT